MTNFGLLIGPAVEVSGSQKDASAPSTEECSWMNSTKTRENISGPTGECKHTLRKTCPSFGRRS